MVTPDTLLQLAIELSVSGDDRTADQALTAARWMEDMRLTQTHQVGPFGGKVVKKGQRVRIKKGTVIKTTHPRYNREKPKIAGRDYVITVYDMYDAWIGSHWHPHKAREAVRNSEVVWAGEGGYWCMVDTALVEIVD